MRDEPNKPLFARRKKWYDLSGDLHPLMAIAITILFLRGLPLLVSIIQPWTDAVFRRVMTP